MFIIIMLGLLIIPFICIFMTSSRISREEEKKEMEEILNGKKKNN